MIKLIVGLGNPGTEYADTRHNAGIWAIAKLAGNLHASFKAESKLISHIAHSVVGHKIYFMVPKNYMNENGIAVQKVSSYFNVKPEEMLVIHDELDLEPGTIRIKNGGGHGGHNGLKSIIQHTGSNQFHRLRIGIGHPGDKNLVAQYVLKKPSKPEKQLIDDAIDKALCYSEELCKSNWQKFANQIH